MPASRASPTVEPGRQLGEKQVPNAITESDGAVYRPPPDHPSDQRQDEQATVKDTGSTRAEVDPVLPAGHPARVAHRNADVVHRRGSWVLGPWVRTGLLVLLAALVVALLIRPKTSTETPDLSGLADKVNAAMSAQTGVTHSSAGYLPGTGIVLVSNLTGVSTSQLSATLAAAMASYTDQLTALPAGEGVSWQVTMTGAAGATDSELIRVAGDDMLDQTRWVIAPVPSSARATAAGATGTATGASVAPTSDAATKGSPAATASAAALATAAAIGGGAAVLWVKFMAPPTLVVNDSYPLLLFVGIAWLGLLLSVEKWLGKRLTNRWTGPTARWLGRRSISVYLWHPIAIVGAYWMLAKLLGAFPTCPCSLDNGVKVYSSIGHNGGQTTVQYAAKQDVIIAANLTESMWTNDLSQADVAELLTSVEQAVSPS